MFRENLYPLEYLTEMKIHSMQKISWENNGLKWGGIFPMVTDRQMVILFSYGGEARFLDLRRCGMRYQNLQGEERVQFKHRGETHYLNLYRGTDSEGKTAPVVLMGPNEAGQAFRAPFAAHEMRRYFHELNLRQFDPDRIFQGKLKWGRGSKEAIEILRQLMRCYNIGRDPAEVLKASEGLIGWPAPFDPTRFLDR